jgi:hypothetical protein
MSATNLNFVFCAPQPGKVNPHEPKVPGVMRSRVIQKEQKGPTCCFYAMQILRNEYKIGKFPSEEQRMQRYYEKLLSDHRKQVTRVSDKWMKVNAIADLFKTFFSRPCSKKEVEQIFPQTMHALSPEEQILLSSALQDFYTQEEYSELSAYVKAAKEQESIAINIELLNEFDLSNEWIKNSYERISNHSWEESSSFDKHLHTNNLVTEVSRKAYRLKKSLFHPKKPISHLIEQLHIHGPHLVGGKFGEAYYTTPLFELKNKIEGRPVFGWPPNAARKALTANHAVVVVGAQIEKDKEYIYFIDPNDESKPDDYSTQKIYVMSYKKFQSMICDLNGRSCATPSGVPIFSPVHEERENNYALHM